MPLPMQVKLLRVLQERLFDRVGGGKPIQADVRIIAATHRDLEAMIRTQGFREDLYYRLNVFPIETPPLRERADDIPLLLQELLNRHAELHQGMIRLTQRAMESLMQYPGPATCASSPTCWSGCSSSIRSRSSTWLTCRAAIGCCRASRGRAADRDGRARCAGRRVPGSARAGSARQPRSRHATAGRGVNLKEMLADLEVELIRQALESQDGVVARAADLLGMRRTTLVEKMKNTG